MIYIITENEVIRCSNDVHKILVTTPKLIGTPFYCITQRLVNMFSTSENELISKVLNRELGSFCLVFENEPNDVVFEYWSCLIQYMVKGYDYKDSLVLMKIGLAPKLAT